VSYPVLSYEEFGAKLLSTQDLDPVYVALLNANLPHQQLQAWLLAYWCFYDVGTASWMAEAFDNVQGFWDRMEIAAVNDKPAPTGGRWKRGKERRHFRGKAAIIAVAKLSTRNPEPGEMVWKLCNGVQSINMGRRCECKDVMRIVKEEYLFGDWIAFKAADMLERVLHLPIDFSDGAPLMFSEPQAGARMVVADMLGKEGKKVDASAVLVGEWDQKIVTQVAVAELQRLFGDQTAPPVHRFQRKGSGRKVGLQEIETILCKYKSHVNGHYPVGNDIMEVRHALQPWRDLSPVAAKLLEGKT